MLPEGWKETRVNKCIAGLNAGVSVNSEERQAGPDEFAVLKTSCVSNGHFNYSEHKAVTNEEEIRRLKEPVKANTILISRMNTPQLVGANAYVARDEPWLFLPDRLWQTKPLGTRTSMKWLSYWFASPPVRKRLSNLATGTSGSMKNIAKRDVLFMKLDLPPLPEQTKIARILSTWDEAIETTEKLIQNSRQQKKALMQQLLTGKKRLPGFSGEWSEGKLSDLVEVNPKGIKASEGADVTFLRMDAVSERGEIMYREDRPYQEVKKGFTSFGDGDTLVAKITPCFENGKGAFASGLIDGIGFGSTEFHVLRAKKSVCPEYIFFITRTYEFRARGEANMQGSAGQRRVPPDFLKLYKLRFPNDRAEQKAIAKLLIKCKERINRLDSLALTLSVQKQALMQTLLTGERRVEV